MEKHKITMRPALTLVEVMVVVVIVGVLIIAVGVTLVDSQKTWTAMYNRANSGPSIEGVLVNREFDRVVRKAGIEQCDVDGDHLKSLGSSSVRVYYYKDPLTATDYDGYTQFSVDSNKNLRAHEGDATKVDGVYYPADSPTLEDGRIVAQNVQNCEIRVPGASVEMVLTLDDNRVKMTVVCSAVRHNQLLP